MVNEVASSVNVIMLLMDEKLMDEKKVLKPRLFHFA